MARPSPELIDALLATADRLERGHLYRWTHMGHCNCGHLAQTLTSLSPEEIHRSALEKAGDWTEQARAYCPTSGYLIDHVLSTMMEVGLDTSDIEALEKLSDHRVLARLPPEQRRLFCGRREHVVLYLRAWAQGLAEALPQIAERPQAVAVDGRPRIRVLAR